MQSLHEDIDSYYQNVIQAFVEEAINLSQLLEKGVVDKQPQNLLNLKETDRTSTSLQNLDTLDFSDWVSFLEIYNTLGMYREFLEYTEYILGIYRTCLKLICASLNMFYKIFKFQVS